MLAASQGKAMVWNSMKKFIIVVTLCLFALAPTARAQTATNLSIVIQSASSAAISCPVNYPTGKTSFTAPVAAGSLIATCSVTPAGWSGALTLSGADAASFALSGFNLNVGAAAITNPKTYSVTVTATP
jgi:hypothetical protein